MADAPSTVKIECPDCHNVGLYSATGDRTCRKCGVWVGAAGESDDSRARPAGPATKAHKPDGVGCFVVAQTAFVIASGLVLSENRAVVGDPVVRWFLFVIGLAVITIAWRAVVKR